MTAYLERLRPSAAYWVLVPVAALMAGVSGVPLGPAIAAGAAVVTGAGVAVLLALRAPEVRVDDTGLRAGPAFLEAGHLGEVEPLEAEATRHALGPGLRADAYVVHRSWVRTAVRVAVDDDRDPTPYWLISTRNPEELARAVTACRDAARGDEGDQAAHSEQTG